MLGNHSTASCIIVSREATLYSSWSAKSELMNGGSLFIARLRSEKVTRLIRRIWHQKWGTGRDLDLFD
jgi:hypothetical protein